MKKTILSLALILCLIAGLALPAAATARTAETEPAADPGISLDDYFSERDLSGEWNAKKAVEMRLTDSVTITEAGVYVLTGTISDGTVTVNVTSEDKVQLVLAGVSITSSSSAAILVENADKVFITLAPDSDNFLTSTGFDAASDVDAVIFSRDDLVLNGSGMLTISSAKHAVVGKDDVKVTGGVYDITAAGRGLDANDSMRIAGGDFTIVSGKDAIRAKHDEAEKGYVLICGGVFDLPGGGGSAGVSMDERDRDSGGGSGGMTAVDSDSMKALKASGDLTILDGQFTIDAADDALHSDSNVSIYGGDFTISTGDDGMHANSALTIYGGDVRIVHSYEGLEACTLTVAGGSVSIIASDDGMNSSGGNDSSGWGGNDMFANDGSSITISGGQVYVNATGDGVDSNGDLIVSGGSLVVSGPTTSMNGALDKNGSATITGGTVIAAGSSGMAETFGSGSTQCSALVNLRANPGEIVVTDAEGNVVLSGTVEKVFQTVVISSPDLVEGQTYTVSCSGASVTFTASIASNNGGFGGGQGGFGGGQDGSGGGQGGSGGGSGGGPGR